MQIEDFEGRIDHNFIFCLNAINHMRDMSSALQKMVDILSKNGTLILSCDVHNWSLFFYQTFRIIPGDILHPHQITKKETDSLLSSHGLAIKQCQLLNKKGDILRIRVGLYEISRLKRHMLSKSYHQ